MNKSRSIRKSSALVARRVAPVEVVLSKPDHRLVDETVEWIRNRVAQTVFKGVVEIGTYVLDRFFDGDPAQARASSPRKGESFRSLAERCAEDPTIRMSKSALHRAVGIAAVVKHLPAKAAYRRLASSHQGALLPMHDPDKIERLARTVLADELTVTEVVELVSERKEAPPGARRGRPAKPVILKALERSLKAFSLDGSKAPFTAAQINALDFESAKRARASAEALVERLQKLIERL